MSEKQEALNLKAEAQRLVFLALYEKHVKPSAADGRSSVKLPKKYTEEEAKSLCALFAKEDFATTTERYRSTDSDGDPYGPWIFAVTVYI